MFKKSLFILFAVVGLVSAQHINWTGLSDTGSFPNFKKDSLKISRAFLCNNENHVALFMFSDTVNAGKASDSVNVEVGYQMGAPVRTLAGVYDTVWTNFIVLDTINTLSIPNSGEYNPNIYGQQPNWAYTSSDKFGGYPTRVVGQLDTTVTGQSVALFTPFEMFWTPFIRFYAKGLAKNCGTFMIARVIYCQRLYNNVRNQ
jgi:hypothetical protein